MPTSLANRPDFPDTDSLYGSGVKRARGDSSSGPRRRPTPEPHPTLLIPSRRNPLNASKGDWSRDGRYLLYGEAGPNTFDLWVLPLGGDRKAIAVAQTPFDEIDGQFSPDRRWIAYTSNESGRNEVYVQAFPGSEGAPGGKWQVSNQGGRAPRWRGDGKELFYLAVDNKKVVAAGIRTAPRGVETDTSRELFATSVPGDNGDNLYPYDVAADGRRFLIEETTDIQSAPLTVVVNRQAKLKP